MKGKLVSHRVRAFALVGMVALLVGTGDLSARAGPPAPSFFNVDLHPAALLAPDGQTVSVGILARCPERWSVVRTLVTISQPQASGEASFPLTCTGLYQGFSVTVQSSGAPFQLGGAQGSALVIIERGHGRRAQVQDTEAVHVDPSVFVNLADAALLQSGGQAVTIDVTVACPVGTSGQQSYVNVSQGLASGNGFYVPGCDGQPHTFNVMVPASQGQFQAGTARAFTFAFVQGGSGIDERDIQIIS